MNLKCSKTAVFYILSFFVGCSGSSHQSIDLISGDGIATVSGSINADFTGEASAYELHLGDNNSWTIVVRDSDSELFSILLLLNTTQRVYWPGPGIGEYKIGSGELDSGTFAATYYHLQAGVTYDPNTGDVLTPIPAYSTQEGSRAGGNLIIEVVNDHFIKGSFLFTALRVTQPDSDDIITVEGRFIAERKR